MSKKTFAVLALAIGLIVPVAWRLTAQGALPAPPDPDRALARVLAEDLGRMRGPDDLVVVPQAARDTTPSVYNSAYLWAAMRAAGAGDRAPSDTSLAELARSSTTVDLLWAWEWACTAAAG